MGLAGAPRTLDEDTLGLVLNGSGNCLLHLGSNAVDTDAQFVHILLKHLPELESENGTPGRHDIRGQGRQGCAGKHWRRRRIRRLLKRSFNVVGMFQFRQRHPGHHIAEVDVDAPLQVGGNDEAVAILRVPDSNALPQGSNS